MCGIIAAIISNTQQTTNCIDILYEGLCHIQNRGYDSAGVSFYENQQLKTIKYASTPTQSALSKIKENINDNTKQITQLGIGHTRWATHGPKTDINSHPHTSDDGLFTIVHNGIIENFKDLKEELINNGKVFQSQTDTEVIVQLLSNLYKKYSCKTAETVVSVIKEATHILRGTWGLAILCNDTPDTLYLTRHGSPLLISYTDDVAIVSSEQAGFGNKVNNYFILKNFDICVIKQDPTTINTRVISHTNTDTNAIQLKKINHQDTLFSFDPAPFEYWTLKEIMDQEISVSRAISFGGRLLSMESVKLGGLEGHQSRLITINSLVLLGCGSSLNAAHIGVHYFKDLCDFDYVIAIDGAEFTEADIPRKGITGMILLSQSGETKDLYRCLEIANKRGIITIGIVNVVDSLIAREVTCGVYLNAGREVGVASTKSFTSQCIILSMISIWFSQRNKYRKKIQIHL